MGSRAGHIASNGKIRPCIIYYAERGTEAEGFSSSSVLEINPRPVSWQSPISFQLWGPLQEQLAGVRAGSPQLPAFAASASGPLLGLGLLLALTFSFFLHSPCWPSGGTIELYSPSSRSQSARWENTLNEQTALKAEIQKGKTFIFNDKTALKKQIRCPAGMTFQKSRLLPPGLEKEG